MQRLRQLHLRPSRDLGQNFLVDSNILAVIAREAKLQTRDVVLEIGGGIGVLSEQLAQQVSHLHVVEIDRRLERALTDALAPFGNVTLYWGDAMKIDLAALRPAPTKLVANLPYGIAASVLLRTVEELQGIESWVAMVQREVGERLAASPGGGEYGASSAIVQLCCEVQVLRPIPRTVFRPVPNVDSVLLGMRRTGLGASAQLRQLIKWSFAHRRKALPRSIALAAEGSGGPTRRAVIEALEKLGLPEHVRAERLAPEQFRQLGALLGYEQPPREVRSGADRG